MQYRLLNSDFIGRRFSVYEVQSVLTSLFVMLGDCTLNFRFSGISSGDMMAKTRYAEFTKVSMYRFQISTECV